MIPHAQRHRARVPRHPEGPKGQVSMEHRVIGTEGWRDHSPFLGQTGSPAGRLNSSVASGATTAI